MKKLIFLTATILALGVLSAQTTDKPIIKKSIYYGKSKPIRDMDVVLQAHIRKSKRWSGISIHQEKRMSNT